MIGTRRAVLRGLMGVAACGTAPALADTAISLAALADRRGITLGSQVGLRELRDHRFCALIDRECAIVAPGSEFKLAAIQPTGPGTYDFAQGDRIASFARDHAKQLRGHTLLWTNDAVTPEWLLKHNFGPRPKPAAEALLRGYVRHVAAHFGRQIVAWDVVNEAIDRRTGALRDSVFPRMLGLDAIRIAFAAAREVQPEARLVYNDYMDWRSDREPHRRGVLALLRWLRDNDVPIDTLGIQGHIRTGETPVDPARWDAFLNAVGALGLDIAITEFDVDDQRAVGSIADRDRDVALTARHFLDQTLNFPQVKQLVLWGLCDRYSWLTSAHRRSDSAPTRPTPYDADYRPKPLRDAIAQALRTAPDRAKPVASAMAASPFSHGGGASCWS